MVWIWMMVNVQPQPSVSQYDYYSAECENWNEITSLNLALTMTTEEVLTVLSAHHTDIGTGVIGTLDTSRLALGTRCVWRVPRTRLASVWGCPVFKVISSCSNMKVHKSGGHKGNMLAWHVKEPGYYLGMDDAYLHINNNSNVENSHMIYFHFALCWWSTLMGPFSCESWNNLQFIDKWSLPQCGPVWPDSVSILNSYRYKFTEFRFDNLFYV